MVIIIVYFKQWLINFMARGVFPFICLKINVQNTLIWKLKCLFRFLVQPDQCTYKEAETKRGGYDLPKVTGSFWLNHNPNVNQDYQSGPLIPQSWVFYSLTFLRSWPEIPWLCDFMVLEFQDKAQQCQCSRQPWDTIRAWSRLKYQLNNFTLQNINYTIMDSNTAHRPVFMVFPPEVTASEFQSTKNIATTYESTMPFFKLCTTKIKIFGVSEICSNVNANEGVLGI